jgi:hypothetical protein
MSLVTSENVTNRLDFKIELLTIPGVYWSKSQAFFCALALSQGEISHPEKILVFGSLNFDHAAWNVQNEKQVVGIIHEFC